MKNFTKKMLVILSLCLISLIIIAFIIDRFSPIGCSYQYNLIDNELQSANYCTVDSDCTILPLSGFYVDFGCYHYINKDVDGEQIYKKMDDYLNRCLKFIDKCAPTPEAKCVSNKCIEKN